MKNMSFESPTEKREKIEEYYSSLEPFLKTFAHSEIPSFRIDPRADTFAFDHQRGEIIVSPRLIETLNLEREKQIYILLHELSHLIQLFQSTDDYLQSFEIPKRKAKEVPSKISSFVERAWHNFFNTFFDIHANSIIRQRHSLYQRQERLEKLPQDLYQKNLFPETDYSQAPLSQQFIDYLLRKTMVKGEEIKVSPEVMEKIQKEVHFFGKKYKNVEEFVQEEIFDSQKDISEIMYILKTFLMSDFEELLRKDIQSGKIIEIPSHSGIFDIDSDLSEKTIKEIAEGIKEGKKSAKEKMEDYSRKWLKDWAKEKGFSEKEIKRILEMRERTLRLISDLESLWYNFIQRSFEIRREEKAGFKSGISVDSEELLRQLPVLLTQPSEAKIFSRYVGETVVESIKPRRITVFLIVDLSGSMDEKKREAVQEVGYAILKSLINFRRTGEMENPDFPVEINYRILGFGNSAEELIPYDEKERKKQDTPSQNLDEELLRGILAIGKINLGGTQDAKALNLVKKSISPEIEKDLLEDNEIMVILEITDGETETVEESKKIVQELNAKKNVYCRAIQIPGPIYSEKPEKETENEGPELIPRFEKKVLPPTGTFAEVWGSKLGKRLENLGVLTETVIAILYDALSRRLT